MFGILAGMMIGYYLGEPDEGPNPFERSPYLVYEYVPSCYPKVFGPYGKTCNDFALEEDCSKYYTNSRDFRGDQLCGWKDGVCFEESPCNAPTNVMPPMGKVQ